MKILLIGANGQVGWVTATGNLMGALALFPGARMVGHLIGRQAVRG